MASPQEVKGEKAAFAAGFHFAVRQSACNQLTYPCLGKTIRTNAQVGTWQCDAATAFSIDERNAYRPILCFCV
jgi:hypothetical protein